MAHTYRDRPRLLFSNFLTNVISSDRIRKLEKIASARDTQTETRRSQFLVLSRVFVTICCCACLHLCFARVLSLGGTEPARRRKQGTFVMTPTTKMTRSSSIQIYSHVWVYTQHMRIQVFVGLVLLVGLCFVCSPYFLRHTGFIRSNATHSDA